ncbi:hypothetical protein [Halobaculum halobium]
MSLIEISCWGPSIATVVSSRPAPTSVNDFSMSRSSPPNVTS